MIVVDASLGAKWFLNERDSDRARSFLREHSGQICGPDMLAIEVSRALVAAANARRIGKDTARAAMSIWLESVDSEALILYPTTSMLIQRSVDIALDIGHPLADCLYLALAIDLDCDLATCDAKFQAKAAAAHSRVKLLADFN